MSVFTTEFNQENSELTLFTTDRNFNYPEMMDELGDYDIVTASEIEHGYIAMDGMVYNLDDMALSTLQNTGQVTLSMVGLVAELADDEFKKWYYE